MFAECCEQRSGCLAALWRGKVHLSPSCLFPQQRTWSEGLLSLGFPKVHSVPSSLTEPRGTDSLEEFMNVLLWGV